MSDLFSVPVTVREYETDTQGHLKQTVHLNCAEHARRSGLRAAGVSQATPVRGGVGPVAPETAIRHLREPLAGDEAEVTCVPVRGDCKAFRVQQTLRRTDGTVAAEGEAIGALVDRTSREPVPDPEQRLRGLASVPASVGL